MTLSSLVLVALFVGFGTDKREERDTLLNKPVNCETAAEDIAALEAAMPSRRERAKSLFKSLSPVGAARGVVTGTYRDNAEILIGRTEEELTARVKEIQVACGKPDATETAKP